jgi:hypothetical protein
VLRLKQQKSHKLSLPWEGPFVISKALLNGSYYLVDIRELDKQPNKKRKRRDPDDIYDITDRPWNIAQLRPFYTLHLPRLCNRHLYRNKAFGSLSIFFESFTSFIVHLDLLEPLRKCFALASFKNPP